MSAKRVDDNGVYMAYHKTMHDRYKNNPHLWTEFERDSDLTFSISQNEQTGTWSVTKHWHILSHPLCPLQFWKESQSEESNREAYMEYLKSFVPSVIPVSLVVHQAQNLDEINDFNISPRKPK